jgi:uroporphyrinogen-III synthase
LATVFISRVLDDSSVFKSLLTERGWTVEGQSLLELTPLPFRELPEADWIFFSSGNAVRFFFDNLKVRQIEIPAVRWAAFGPSTAGILAGFTGKVDFAGTGEPDATAQRFGEIAARSTVLFPDARNARQSVRQLLGPRINSIRIELYDNTPVADPPLRREGVLVFTSPLNARAYFGHHKLLNGQKTVAIGIPTAEALRELGVKEVAVAREASERGLAEVVMSYEL